MNLSSVTSRALTDINFRDVMYAFPLYHASIKVVNFCVCEQKETHKICEIKCSP